MNTATSGRQGRRRRVPLLTLLGIGLGLGLAAAACARKEGPTDAPPSQKEVPLKSDIKVQYSELTPVDAARLAEQRELIAGEVAKRFGARLERARSDLASLQRLLDERVFRPDQTDELQSLGVAFGDILASETGLHWMVVNDEYGRDPVLVRGHDSFQVNALTMISKRVEDGDHVDMAELFEQVAARVRDTPSAAR